MKRVETESSVTLETDNERRQSQFFRKIVELWPLIVVAVSGIVAMISFWNNVNSVVSEQKAFKATVDARRDQSHKDMEDIRTRITKLEQWKDDLKVK